MRGRVHLILHTAGTLEENLLLEYTQGMAASDIGWGCVNGLQVLKPHHLHTEASDSHSAH